MAGNYPDVPGHRFAIDNDGTQGFRGVVSGTTWSFPTQMTTTELGYLVDDSSTVVASSAGGGRAWLIYFSEPRNVSGLYMAFGSFGPFGGGDLQGVWWSSNTTNGTDGTWTAMTTTGIGGGTTYSLVDSRNNIIAQSVSGCRAIRLQVNDATNRQSSLAAMHIYGSIPLTSNPDRLVLWDSTLDQPLTGSSLDMGDVQRSASATKTFRVKNLSATLTAQSISLSFNALTDGTPSVAASLQASSDGSTFSSTLNIGDLAPGAISSVLTIKLVLPSNAPIGLWSPRISAVAGSWV
jgi:hypothetical protein